MKAIVSTITAVFIAFVACLAPASAQTPPGPTTLSTVNFGGVTPPAGAELVQEIIDFAPGAATATQTRGGDLFVTVLEGQVSLRRGTSDFYYAASASTNASTFRVARGEAHSIRNVNGSIKARIFASTLLPPNAALTTDQSGAPAAAVAPVVAMTSRAKPATLPAQVSVLHVIWEFQPGAATPPHTHHGFFLVTVTEGELGRLRLESGVEDIIRAGDYFIETSDSSYDAVVRNSSPARSRNAFTVLAERTPPSTNLPSLSPISITPPRTGDAGLVPRAGGAAVE